CDGNLKTKYVSFGECRQGGNQKYCGLNTGFYFELERGLTLINGIRICTANDCRERDPMIVSLEGSNQSETNLTLGISWTLLYNDTSGLENITARNVCGLPQLFNNTIEYKSYRFLVHARQNRSDCVQYSEVQLYSF
ncbi:unnamed protein product, partial [Adineta ricciae]